MYNHRPAKKIRQPVVTTRKNTILHTFYTLVKTRYKQNYIIILIVNNNNNGWWRFFHIYVKIYDSM